MKRDPRDDRVLAIMAKAPRPGHVKTRLAAGYPPDAVVALYRAFVEDSVDLARSLGLRTIVVCPAGDEEEMRAWLAHSAAVLPQRGNGLASALASTFDQLCTVDRRPVVAFNGDGPHLAPNVLQSAFAALDQCDLVVGPCDDGGYYLVGCTRPHAGLFDGDAMSTGSALQVLLDRAACLGLRTALTASHYDVDLPDDLARLARELTCTPGRAPRTAALLAAWEVAARRARS